MTKINKTIKGLGVIAMLGAAMIPLSSYATNPDEIDVTVIVNPVISMTLNSTASVTLGANSVDLTTLSTTATVSTNSLGGYILTLRDTGGNTTGDNGTTTSLTSDDGYEIQTKAGTPTASSAQWGVQLPNSENWVALPASTETPLTVKDHAATTTSIVSDASTVKYGVSTGRVPAGFYSNTVTYTATTKNS